MNAPALIDPTLDQLAAEINAEHDAAERTARTAIDHARLAGDRLLLAKAQVEHGQWLPWLKTNCPAVSERTARAYMQLARDWKTLESQNGSTVADLSFRQAIKLLSAPKPANLTKKRLPATPAKTAVTADLPKSEPPRPVTPAGKHDWFDAPMPSFQPTVESKSVKALQDKYLAFSDAARRKALGLPEPVAEPQRLDLGFLDMPDSQELDGRLDELLDRMLPVVVANIGFGRVIRPIEELRDFIPEYVATLEQAQATVDLLDILTQQARLRLAWLESHPEQQTTKEMRP